jgi:hypothetical protein
MSPYQGDRYFEHGVLDGREVPPGRWFRALR